MSSNAVAVDILSLLSAASLGTLDVSLFREYLPDNPDVCGAVFTYGGMAPVVGFGSTDIQFETPGIQVRFRGAPGDVDGPRVKAETAYRTMAAVQVVTIGGTIYNTIIPRHNPFILTRDEKLRVVWAFSSLCEREPVV